MISVPLGVGAAIFLSELAPPKLSNACTFLVELLAAVPSVILGLLAIFTLVPLMRQYVEPFLKHTLGFLPLFQGPAYGVGYLTAGMILAIMTFPFIISISREALLAVPREQREAALALGATKWESTWQVVVPFARLGIIGSIFLALARALGRNHGRHHGHRQRHRHPHFPAFARLYHRRRSSPTSSPKPPATSISALWSNLDWSCSRSPWS